MTKPKSEFEKWFVAQHGRRQFWYEKHQDKELQDWIDRGNRASTELANRQLWDEKRQSAHYAWSAKIHMAKK